MDLSKVSANVAGLAGERPNGHRGQTLWWDCTELESSSRCAQKQRSLGLTLLGASCGTFGSIKK